MSSVGNRFNRFQVENLIMVEVENRINCGGPIHYNASHFTAYTIRHIYIWRGIVHLIHLILFAISTFHSLGFTYSRLICECKCKCKHLTPEYNLFQIKFEQSTRVCMALVVFVQSTILASSIFSTHTHTHTHAYRYYVGDQLNAHII